MLNSLIMLAQQNPFTDMNINFTSEEAVASGVAIGAIFMMLLMFMALMALPTIFYLLTLQKTLNRCQLPNRTMTPGLVWLQIIPFFGIIWAFFNVINIADSLEKELASRGIQEINPGKNLGLAMCITSVCSVIPYLGFFAAIASLILWIIYWIKIADFSNRIAQPVAFAPENAN